MSEYGTERRSGGRGLIWLVLGFLVVGLGLLGVAFFAGGSIGPGRTTVAPGVLKIVASTPPLAWPARELAPDAQIDVLTRAGGSPHDMELTPAQLRAIAEADVVLLVGLGLDDAVRRAVDANPRAGRQLVVLEDALDLAGVRPLSHSHADGTSSRTDAGHGVHDPHAWLDPMVMRVFVGRVDAALARATGGVAIGAAALQQRCDSIDHTYRIALNALTQRAMVCQHNAYGYLAARYGLDIVAVIQPVESGEVSPGDLKRAVEAIRSHRIGAIFVEPGASSVAAQRVADETGVRVLTLDPLGTGDWPALMNANLEALIEGLSARAPARRPEDEADDGDS